MPGASFHSFYWQTQVPEPPPDTPGGAGRGGVPAFQATTISVIAGSGFGVFQPLWDWLRKVMHGDA